jgi:hypothetical protein
MSDPLTVMKMPDGPLWPAAGPGRRVEAFGPSRGRRGFIAFYAFILLLILGIFGIGYWATSRLTTDMIVKEAHRIQARNFAQAGVEKVLVNIMNQYRLGNRNLEYPNRYTVETVDKEYKVSFGDGSYEVERVVPYTAPQTDLLMLSVPYYKNRVLIGQYDVWEITVAGRVSSSGVTARVRTLTKVIRTFVQY